MVRSALVSLIFAAAIAVATDAQAQFGVNFAQMASSGRPSIVGSGETTIRLQPTELQLYVQIVVRGNGLEDALAKLTERKATVTKQLETLKVDKKQIRFTPASLSVAQNARSRQFEAIVMEQLRNRGKKTPKGLQPPKTIAVTSTLIASWPLEAKDHEQLLVMVHNLQEKVKQADLSGSKELEKLSPEEQELAEEGAKIATQNGEEASPVGQPVFFFVATISAAEREKALAAAIAKAKTDAEQLARAAQVRLGPLVGVSGNVAPSRGQGEENVFRYGSSDQFEFVRHAMAQSTDDDGANSLRNAAIATEPSKLQATVTASATYEIAK